MIQKPMLVMQHCQPLMLTSQFQEMLIFQFQKILNQNFKKLILVCWSGVPDCINKYVIIMLINMMKSDEFTLTMMFSNLIWLHTKNPDQNIIVIAFKSLGFSWKKFCWYTDPHSCKILATSLIGNNIQISTFYTLKIPTHESILQQNMWGI